MRSKLCGRPRLCFLLFLALCLALLSYLDVLAPRLLSLDIGGPCAPADWLGGQAKRPTDGAAGAILNGAPGAVALVPEKAGAALPAATTTLVTTVAGPKEYRPKVHLNNSECGLQAFTFPSEKVTSLEACDQATAANDACGKYFMWSLDRPAWACRCCTPLKERDGGRSAHWKVYEVQSPLPVWRQNPTPPPPPETPQQLLVPLYARGRRCKVITHKVGKTGTVAACRGFLAGEASCTAFVMFSASRPDWGCRCCDAEGADREGPAFHHWDVYHFPGDLSQPFEVRRPRLYMLAATVRKGLPRAVKLEESLRKRMGPDDYLSFICGSNCAPTARSMLKDVIEMPDSVTDSIQVIPECTNPHQLWICNHRMGAMKFIYGLVTEVRRMLSTGYPMPKWWLVMDDDTYVHFDNLMLALDKEKDGKPLWQSKASFASRVKGCPGICGGAGWLLSGALAEELGGRLGEKYLAFAAERIVNHAGFYDMYVPDVVRWAGAEVQHMPEANEFSPLDSGYVKRVARGDFDDGPVVCHKLPYCNCSRSAKPALWHVKIDFDKAIEVLDKHQ